MSTPPSGVGPRRGIEEAASKHPVAGSRTLEQERQFLQGTARLLAQPFFFSYTAVYTMTSIFKRSRCSRGSSRRWITRFFRVLARTCGAANTVRRCAGCAGAADHNLAGRRFPVDNRAVVPALSTAL